MQFNVVLRDRVALRFYKRIVSTAVSRAFDLNFL